ncbi:MAG: peptidase dimerization domain-containing protein, partial [Actinobacteria bacterium]|nr:peptidase dimerization domain-containing protein [Actinomycetota bacterium]
MERGNWVMAKMLANSENEVKTPPVTEGYAIASSMDPTSCSVWSLCRTCGTFSNSITPVECGGIEIRIEGAVTYADCDKGKMNIKVEGTPGHSGTTPMHSREDALVTAAQIILAVREVALSRYGEGTVGTVGNIKVNPGVMNVIPGVAEMWVDIRGV